MNEGVCVCGSGEKEYSQIAPQAAGNRALTPRLAVGGKRGWAEERKRERREAEREEGGVCVRERESERERARVREKHGRTAASIFTDSRRRTERRNRSRNFSSFSATQGNLPAQ